MVAFKSNFNLILQRIFSNPNCQTRFEIVVRRLDQGSLLTLTASYTKKAYLKI